MADHPLTELLAFPNATTLRGFEGQVRERLSGVRRLTVPDAFLLIDGRRQRFSPAVSRRMAALLVLFGYVDDGDGTFTRTMTYKDEAKRAAEQQSIWRSDPRA